jgi:hypothetical protein
MKPALTAEFVAGILHYNRETGEFTWISGRGSAKAGSVAGSPDSDGYIAIGIAGARYLAHRLAWLVEYGSWPDGCVDHIDCIKTNNAVRNLRLADQSQNRCNVRRQRVNSTGFKGVHYNKHAKRFRAIAKARGESRFLGYFDRPEDAHAAYCAAIEEMHGEYARAA